MWQTRAPHPSDSVVLFGLPPKHSVPPAPALLKPSIFLRCTLLAGRNSGRFGNICFATLVLEDCRKRSSPEGEGLEECGQLDKYKEVSQGSKSSEIVCDKPRARTLYIQKLLFKWAFRGFVEYVLIACSDCRSTMATTNDEHHRPARLCC